MPSTTLLQTCTLAVALAATPALAQDAAPAIAAAPTQAQTDGSPAQGDAYGQDPTENPERAEAQAAAPAISAASVSIARWVRAIGGRICTGPRLTPNDRISRPDPHNQAQGWRVSVPSFAACRISAPPARAHAARTETAGEPESAEVAEPVQTASEPIGN